MAGSRSGFLTNGSTNAFLRSAGKIPKLSDLLTMVSKLGPNVLKKMY